MSEIRVDTYRHEGHDIVATVMDGEDGFAIALTVDGETDQCGYVGVATVGDYRMCTAYYEGAFPVLRPFKVTPLEGA